MHNQYQRRNLSNTISITKVHASYFQNLCFLTLFLPMFISIDRKWRWETEKGIRNANLLDESRSSFLFLSIYRKQEPQVWFLNCFTLLNNGRMKNTKKREKEEDDDFFFQECMCTKVFSMISFIGIHKDSGVEIQEISHYLGEWALGENSLHS